ncbi:hypothetical protein ACPW96_02570 [Micromonospora sp. DT81.3]|uniref:hypothetical protein n=1 Tax=Micromonospora sp. DT81.3 TaxID=3416523 RepID=UPI003CF5FDAA
MADGSTQGRAAEEKEPTNDELEEPSTEKEPGEEPKSDDGGEPPPSHQAVGIGVVGGPLVDAEQDSADD